MKLNECPVCGHTPLIKLNQYEKDVAVATIKCSNSQCPLCSVIPELRAAIHTDFSDDFIHSTIDKLYEDPDRYLLDIEDIWNNYTQHVSELVECNYKIQSSDKNEIRNCN